MIRIYSFDVFDTCVIRRCAVPTDVFVEVARRIPHTSIVGNWEQDFVAARITAEQRARAVGEEEVALSEIWQQLVQMVPGLNMEAGVALEMEVEREWIRPNPAMLTRVNRRRSEGHRIVFTSDTSLPAEFIRERLAAYGFWQSGDGLYVSSEQRATKRTGALFARLLAQEGVRAREVCHVGNDPASDGRVPKRIGLRTEFVMETRLQGAELELLRQTDVDAAYVRPLVGAMREARLAASVAPELAAGDVVAGFLGPFILTWASWILPQAKRDGVSRLYFLSRDGFLLCNACKLLAKESNGIDCRYLEVSRQSLFLPSIEEVSPAGMPWLRRDTEIPRLGHLLAKLEMTLEDLGPQLHQLAGRAGENFLLRTDRDWQVFWACLGAADVREKILKRSEERRDAALMYFRQVGLADSVDYAVVDLGWFLSGQRALSSVLRRGGLRLPKTGYYLGLEPTRYGPAESGGALALFYRSPFDVLAHCEANSVFRNVTLLEHLVGCANHGTVQWYRMGRCGEWGPNCGPVSAETSLVYAQMQKACLQFVWENRDLGGESPSLRTVRAVLSVLVTNLAERPKRTWVRYLSVIEAATDQNNRNAQPLAKPYRLHEVIRAVYDGMRRRPMESVHRHWETAAHIQSRLICRCIFDLAAVGYRWLQVRRRRRP